MNTLPATLGGIAAVGGFACWAVALVSMLLAARRRRSGAPRPAPFEGRFDVIYRPSLLTPAGLRHHRRCLLALGGVLLCCAFAALAALLA